MRDALAIVTKKALHVTNGDSTAGTVLQTALVERVLPWRDVLHEGPVPALDDEELRRVRAAFLAEDGSNESASILRWLEERDRTLASSRDGELVLWFEADLYDQLGAREARPFLGDAFCFRIIARLARARTPLLDVETPIVGAGTALQLTPAGRRVLDGELDSVRLNWIDRWIGGVHLSGVEARRRWDEGAETIRREA